MALHKASIHRSFNEIPSASIEAVQRKKRKNSLRGLTLIEILVVLTLFLVIGSLALLVSTDTYRGSSFRSDRDLLVALLQHARAQSINNICAGSSCLDGAQHGVHIGGGQFTAFQGSTYNSTDPQNQTFSVSPTDTLSGDTDVVFIQLTGGVSAAKAITLNASGKTSTITIEQPSGRIWWTN